MFIKIIQQAISGFKILTNRRRSKISAVMRVMALNKHRDRPLYIEASSNVNGSSSRANIAEMFYNNGHSPIKPEKSEQCKIRIFRSLIGQG